MDPIEQAIASLRQGDMDAAERHCRAALAAGNRDTQALPLLGVILLRRQAHEEAAGIFERLARMAPATASHWINLGSALRALGRHDEALAAYARAGALGERSPDFLFNVGLLHIDRGDFEAARKLLAQAAQAAPRDAELRYHYAQCCYECTENDEALRAISDWRNLSGLDAGLLARIGSLLMQLGEAEEAEAATRRAVAIAPGDASAELRLILLLERTNRVEEATARLAALEGRIAPDTPDAEELSGLQARLAQRNGDAARARDLYFQMVAATPQSWLRHRFQFPLAKAQDVLRDYDGAHATLAEAHASQVEFLERTTPRFVHPPRDPLAIVRHPTDPADIAGWRDDGAPSVAESPVFIVGFPRSGTTLLEQMLDAHPGLAAMDEQPFLQNAIDHIQRQGFAYPERMAGMAAGQLDDARRFYLDLAAKKARLAPGQRLVDKNPLNLLRLPAIRRLFPNARIILAIRHPCDVVLSCYMQHFRAPPFALLCRDLPTLADGYRRAFDFWYAEAGRLAPSVFDLRYEDLVADPAGHARRIAGYLELPWDERMLHADRRARERGFISTPSYAQVVQPIHTRSVERWRRYERHFAPLLPVLRPYLERWGYAG